MLGLILIENCAFKVMQPFPANQMVSLSAMERNPEQTWSLEKVPEIPLIALSADLCSRPVKLRQIKKLLKD